MSVSVGEGALHRPGCNLNEFQTVQEHEQNQHGCNELGDKEQPLDHLFVLERAAIGERFLVVLETPHPPHENADQQSAHRHEDVGTGIVK